MRPEPSYPDKSPTEITYLRGKIVVKSNFGRKMLTGYQRSYLGKIDRRDDDDGIVLQGSIIANSSQSESTFSLTMIAVGLQTIKGDRVSSKYYTHRNTEPKRFRESLSGAYRSEKVDWLRRRCEL